jgi:hypothetical protein
VALLWRVLRRALMDIMTTPRMRARPMVTTVLTGSQAASSSEPARGFAAAMVIVAAMATATAEDMRTAVVMERPSIVVEQPIAVVMHKAVVE